MRFAGGRGEAKRFPVEPGSGCRFTVLYCMWGTDSTLSGLPASDGQLIFFAPAQVPRLSPSFTGCLNCSNHEVPVVLESQLHMANPS